MLHVWNINLHLVYGLLTYIWPKFMVNVSKYSIHGAFGYIRGIDGGYQQNLGPDTDPHKGMTG